MRKKFSKISEIIKDAIRGKMFILVDDEGRENEGDLVIPALKVTAKSINFMATYGRGLICLALSQSQVNKLNLSLMSPTNNSRTQTAFTVSIESKTSTLTSPGYNCMVLAGHLSCAPCNITGTMGSLVASARCTNPFLNGISFPSMLLVPSGQIQMLRPLSLTNFVNLSIDFTAFSRFPLSINGCPDSQ